MPIDKTNKDMTTRSTKKDLGTKGVEDTVKGTANKAAGKVQSAVGKATGSKKMEAKGKARQVGGTVQSKAGRAEQKVDQKLNEKTLP